jgi:hypothetical protein
MSGPRLRERSDRAPECRNGRPVAIALLPHERTLLRRALALLVEREGSSHTAAEVEQMLERAAPADVMRELSGWAGVQPEGGRGVA